MKLFLLFILSLSLLVLITNAHSASTPPDGNGSLHQWPFSDFGAPYYSAGSLRWDSSSTIDHTEGGDINSVFFYGNAPSGNSNAISARIQRYSFDLVYQNQDILRTHYLMPAKSSFTNISTKLARIEAKIGSDGMNYETAVLIGLFLALIFAVTWRG